MDSGITVATYYRAPKTPTERLAKRLCEVECQHAPPGSTQPCHRLVDWSCEWDHYVDQAKEIMAGVNNEDDDGS